MKKKKVRNFFIFHFFQPKIISNANFYFHFTALANEDKNSKPFINSELSPNVTGVLGKEIRLACHVEDLGNKTVSSKN